jgi:sarcosine oxidase subunit alpha
MTSVIICRCEEVSLAHLLETFEQHPCSSRELKLRTRAGMGYCGGRTCRLLVDKIVQELSDAPLSNEIPLKIWGIPIQLRKAALQIEGKEKVESVQLADLSPNGEIMAHSTRNVPVDFVCMAGSLYPLAELAAVAGCPFRFVPELGGHVPLHNAQLQTPLTGLFVAGNITGIESAKVAAAQGTVAGISIAAFRGVSGTDEELQRAIRNVWAVREQALIQFHPQVAEGRRHIQTMYAEAML